MLICVSINSRKQWLRPALIMALPSGPPWLTACTVALAKVYKATADRSGDAEDILHLYSRASPTIASLSANHVR